MAVANQHAGLPSGSSATRTRATGFASVGKKQGAGHSAIRSGTLPPQSSIFKPAAILNSLPKSSNLQNSGSRYGVPNAPTRVTGFGTGERAKQQDAGHSVKSSIPKTPRSLPPPACESRSRLLQAGVITKETAQVKSPKSCLKKANATCSKKKVRVGPTRVREFVSQPGDRFPGPAELFEGEVNWVEWRRQIAINDEEYLYCRAYADAINEQLRQEENERREYRR